MVWQCALGHSPCKRGEGERKRDLHRNIFPPGYTPVSKYNRFSKNSTKTSGIRGGFLSAGTIVERAVSQAICPLLMFRNAAETSVVGSQKNCLQHCAHLLPQDTLYICHQMSVVVCQDYLPGHHVIPSLQFCCLCLLCSLGRAVLAGPATHFPRHSFRLLHRVANGTV